MNKSNLVNTDKQVSELCLSLLWSSTRVCFCDYENPLPKGWHLGSYHAQNLPTVRGYQPRHRERTVFNRLDLSHRVQTVHGLGSVNMARVALTWFFALYLVGCCWALSKRNIKTEREVILRELVSTNCNSN